MIISWNILLGGFIVWLCFAIIYWFLFRKGLKKISTFFTKEVFKTITLIWFVLVILVMLITGWRLETKPTKPSKLKPPILVPDVDNMTTEEKNQKILTEGLELQKEGKEKLDSFRKDFFNEE